MKSYFVIFLLLFAFQVDFLGQSNVLILTEEQNHNWFVSLESEELSEQIQIVRSRIISDTAVFNANQFRSDRVILQNKQIEDKLKELGNISQGRVMYVVGFKNPRSNEKYLHFNWDNWTSTSQILKFHDFLLPEIIKSIKTINKKADAQAIYGSRASFGVLIFDMSKKRYFKEFLKEIKN